MINYRTKFSKRLRHCTMGLGIFLLLTGYAPVKSSQTPSEAAMMRFDATIELNAPLCGTHAVLFARYWVSPDLYRVAVVWAEPHAGSPNFPIYPPTSNVVSDREAFRIDNQFQHNYDGVFPRPLGRRGVFYHKFNVYYFSDIRFAEQEALNLRIHANDIQPLKNTGGLDGEQVFDVSARRPGDECRQALTRLGVRATEGRLDELRLLDAEGGLLKSVEYEYTNQKDGNQLHKQTVLLPELPITVGFKGKGPAITIAGEKRRYKQFEAAHHPAGRKCIVNYQPIKINGRPVSLPARIIVYSGDGKSILRSARLYNFSDSELSADQLKKSAEQFSLFESNEIKCREMLRKYWLKDKADVAQADVKTMEQLHTHFAHKPAAPMNVGQKLRRANMLLQLDWILGHRPRLERDFREYVSLLTANDLNQMIFVGGKHAIELTIRWGQLALADKLIETWLDAAVSRNNVESALDFAAMSIWRDRFCIIARLMERVLQTPQVSPSQRFVAQALRCTSLARAYEKLKDPDSVKKEIGIAQARWVSSKMSTEVLRRDLMQGITDAKQVFAGLDKPTRQQNALKVQLDNSICHC